MLKHLNLQELNYTQVLAGIKNEEQKLVISTIIEKLCQILHKHVFTMDSYEIGVRYVYVTSDCMLKIKDEGINGQPQLLRIASSADKGKSILTMQSFSKLFYWFGILDDINIEDNFHILHALSKDTKIIILSRLGINNDQEYLYVECIERLFLISGGECHGRKWLYNLHDSVPISVLELNNKKDKIKLRETRRREEKLYWNLYDLAANNDKEKEKPSVEYIPVKNDLRNHELRQIQQILNAKEPLNLSVISPVRKMEEEKIIVKTYTCVVCEQLITGDRVRSECNKGHLDYFHKNCWTNPRCVHSEFDRCIKYYFYTDEKLKEKVKISLEKKIKTVTPLALTAVSTSEVAINTPTKSKRYLTGWKDIDVSAYQKQETKPKPKSRKKKNNKTYLDISQPIAQYTEEDANKAWSDIYFHLDPTAQEFVPTNYLNPHAAEFIPNSNSMSNIFNINS